MQVIRLNNGLAVQLPEAVVDELGLKEGDDLRVVPAGKDAVAVEKVATRDEFLRQLKQFHFPLPDDYRFDREQANER